MVDRLEALDRAIELKDLVSELEYIVLNQLDDMLGDSSDSQVIEVLESCKRHVLKVKLELIACAEELNALTED
jgi:hypothetical protein